MTKGELVQLIYNELPEPNELCDLDFDSEPDAVRFTWKGGFRYRVSTNLFVERLEGGVLICLVSATLIEHILKKAEG